VKTCDQDSVAEVGATHHCSNHALGISGIFELNLEADPCDAEHLFELRYAVATVYALPRELAPGVFAHGTGAVTDATEVLVMVHDHNAVCRPPDVELNLIRTEFASEEKGRHGVLRFTCHRSTVACHYKVRPSNHAYERERRCLTVGNERKAYGQALRDCSGCPLITGLVRGERVDVRKIHDIPGPGLHRRVDCDERVGLQSGDSEVLSVVGRVPSALSGDLPCGPAGNPVAE
jgi:hypothetical protein